MEGAIYFLIVGGIAGWLAGKIMKSTGFGILGNVVLGIFGGILGGWLFGVLGIYTDKGIVGSIITAVVGAVILVWLARRYMK